VNFYFSISTPVSSPTNFGLKYPTARKLAVIIWNKVSKRVEYKAPTEYIFLDQKRKLRLVQNIKKNITKFEIKPKNLGFVTA